MKQEQGFVIETDGNHARIRVGRHDDCTGCGACPSSRQVTVDAVNELGARPGQRVRFEMHEDHALLSAFVIFILPLVAAGVGGLAGWRYGAGDGTDSAVIGAISCFLLSLLGVKLFDRRIARNQRMKPIIVEIL